MSSETQALGAMPHPLPHLLPHSLPHSLPHLLPHSLPRSLPHSMPMQGSKPSKASKDLGNVIAQLKSGLERGAGVSAGTESERSPPSACTQRRRSASGQKQHCE